jgi:hypothetical protein
MGRDRRDHRRHRIARVVVLGKVEQEAVMTDISPKYIDATNLKALAMLALVGAGAYVVVGGVPVVAGGLAVAAVLAIYHHGL